MNSLSELLAIRAQSEKVADNLDNFFTVALDWKLEELTARFRATVTGWKIHNFLHFRQGRLLFRYEGQNSVHQIGEESQGRASSA